MNSSELLERGNILVLQAVDDLPETQWDLPGACGQWSIKDTIGHLASYEQVLITVLTAIQRKQEPSREITEIRSQTDEFNRQEIEKRQYQTAQQVLNEYNDAQVQVNALLSQFPQEQLEQKGTIAWFRPDKSLAELIQGFSEHSGKHAQQIIQFRQQQEQLTDK